ncbi:MAG: RagB/SusD family nutrient uptake outer membrane protein [Bacteroidales bacterium]|nr:RagB/SusD family nutrient uptake outer membrane protein [Bacteroidales bacterium]
MKKLKRIFAVAAVAVTATITFADNPVEVLQLKYTDGIADYIPVDDINTIKFSKGIDCENPALDPIFTMFDNLKKFGETSQHYDFGYPALMLGMDLAANDMYTPNTGYNHFRTWIIPTYGSNTVPNGLMWEYAYSYIRSANFALSHIPTTDTDENKMLAAQALAMRSFAYWNLVQTFAPNVAFAPEAKAVAISTATTDVDETLPLATTTEIYNLIFNDINLAIDYLTDNPMPPALIDVAHAKRFVDLGVAYGLRARYNLTMHHYAEAARDARIAIEKSSARPLLAEAAAYPGFNDARVGNWMWAITVDENDIVALTGIVNFASHVSSLASGGYTSVGTARCCGDNLHSWLASQSDDIRNNWFVDDRNIGRLLTGAQQEVVTQCINQSGLPYANIKFDVYKGKIYGTIHAEDIPLMRVEEMYLIEAEGLAMSGKLADARNKLIDFVRTYRNPSYVCNATDMKDLQTEVLWQRRIELWGEGQAYFDILRLQLDIDRYTDNCPLQYQFRIKGGSDFMRYKYPNVAPYIEGYDYDTQYQVPQPGYDWNE